MINGAIPTKALLSSRINGFPPLCSWYDNHDETIDHLFWSCVLADYAWKFIGKWWSYNWLVHRTGSFSLQSILRQKLSVHITGVACGCGSNIMDGVACS